MSDLPAMVSPWYDNGDITRYVKSQAGRAHVEELKGQLVSFTANIQVRALTFSSWSMSCLDCHTVRLVGATSTASNLCVVHNHDPPVVHGDLKGVRLA